MFSAARCRPSWTTTTLFTLLMVLWLATRFSGQQEYSAERVSPPSVSEIKFPIFPNSVFLTSYDAGRGQRYYLFGTTSSYEEMVRYYTIVLDERGDQVFNAPATHVFEVGRFREEDMAFPPSVTIKDYTWNGSKGYLDPAPGSSTRYATVIQFVPPPSSEIP